MWGDVQSPRVVKGAASATRIVEQLRQTSARAIRGNSPPEEGGATLAASEGPTSYRLVGVAPSDGRRFKSSTAHREPRVYQGIPLTPYAGKSLPSAMNSAKLQPIWKVGAGTRGPEMAVLQAQRDLPDEFGDEG